MRRRLKDQNLQDDHPLSFSEGVPSNCELFTSPLNGNMPIVFGENAVDYLPHALNEIKPDNVFVISDTTIYDLHGHALLESISMKQHVTEILISPGETNKTMLNLERISNRLFERGATRNSLIINFGGGVVLNIGGLASSLIYRGVPFIQIPTTLMAQSDVIVSNKQTINFAAGKNRFGVFSTPTLSIADPQWLKTEPDIQINSALVEYCKNAIILGGQYYENALNQIQSAIGYTGSLNDLIKDSLNQKFLIGKFDPAEKEKALILEYGHTVGHALEYLSKGELLHGEAVFYGMKVAGQLANKMGIFPAEELEKQEVLLNKLPPVSPIPKHIDLDTLMETIERDNKKSGDENKFILMTAIGKAHHVNDSLLTPVDTKILKSVIEESVYAVL